MKLDTLRPYEVRNVHGVVGGLHNSRDWISLKTPRMTPPTIPLCYQSSELDTKSIGQRNWTLQVRSVNGVVCALHSSRD